MTATCDVCFRHCHIEEGAYGACLARRNVNGSIVCDAYGRLTSVALDPIEKKPLYHFHPGSMILSVGSYGCNLHCPFCQNHEISLSGAASIPVEFMRLEVTPPEAVVEAALKYREAGNIGVAFTYNEPLVSYEYLRDTARLVHEAGMYNVLVTAGTAEAHILDAIRPYVDAMNIDLKAFRAETYEKMLGGNLQQTLSFIETAASFCHVEITTLIVPGMNDSEEEIREIASWISSLNGGKGAGIPYHLSRFFPRNRMLDAAPTDVGLIYHLVDVAREKLLHVYPGNC